MLLRKIKEKGVSWFLWRLIREIRTPSNSFFKITVDSILRIRKYIFAKKISSNQSELLYSIFDLKITPITYNIVEFLIDSEYEAKRSGRNGFVAVFVPKGNQPEYGNEQYDSIFDYDSQRWRYYNIVVPITSLSRKCKGVYFLPDRKSVLSLINTHHVYPHLYDGVNLRYIDIVDFYKKFNRPNLVEGLRATTQGLRYINRWLNRNGTEQSLVTITIRESEYDPVRNSNIKEWFRFAVYLTEHGYFPVIVPDTDKSFSTTGSFPGIYVFKECAWNIGLRMALYETAYLNFFVSGGPSLLAAWNNKCSYIGMNFLTKNSIIDNEEAFKEVGRPIRENYRWSLPNQRLNYEIDNFENILSEFNRFVSDTEISRLNIDPESSSV